MTETSPTELGVYAGFVLLVLREVLRFVKDMFARRGDELTGLRKELKGELDTIKNQIGVMAKENTQTLNKIDLSQDREQRFWDRDWPAMVNTVASVTRRVTATESDLMQIQTHLKIAAPTPVHGVHLVSLTPPRGSAIPVPVDDDA